MRASGNDAQTAAGRRILERIFRTAPYGFRARLWDGTEVTLGDGSAPFTVVFRSRDTFRRLVLRPNTLRFAEAYVDGDLDIEGDFFAAMGLANGIEQVRLGIRDRAAITRDLLRLGGL